MSWSIEWKLNQNFDSIIIQMNSSRSSKNRLSEGKRHQLLNTQKYCVLSVLGEKRRKKLRTHRTTVLFNFQLLFCAFVEIYRRKRATTTTANIHIPSIVVHTHKDSVVSLVVQIQTCIQSNVSNEHKAQTNEWRIYIEWQSPE